MLGEAIGSSLSFGLAHSLPPHRSLLPPAFLIFGITRCSRLIWHFLYISTRISSFLQGTLVHFVGEWLGWLSLMLLDAITFKTLSKDRAGKYMFVYWPMHAHKPRYIYLLVCMCTYIRTWVCTDFSVSNIVSPQGSFSFLPIRLFICNFFSDNEESGSCYISFIYWFDQAWYAHTVDLNLIIHTLIRNKFTTQSALFLL